MSFSGHTRVLVPVEVGTQPPSPVTVLQNLLDSGLLGRIPRAENVRPIGTSSVDRSTSPTSAVVFDGPGSNLSDINAAFHTVELRRFVMTPEEQALHTPPETQESIDRRYLDEFCIDDECDGGAATDEQWREDTKNITSEKIPSYFICPITLELMRNPTIAQDGISYEREAILRWLKTNGDDTAVSPKTLLPMGKKLISNRALKSVILDFVKTHNLKNMTDAV